jgi:hypothetical protein
VCLAGILLCPVMASYSMIVPGTKLHEQMCHRKHSYSGSLGIKWLGHEADYSPPSSAKVKNGHATPPLLHTSLRCGVHLITYSGNFTSLFFYSGCYAGVRII